MVIAPFPQISTNIWRNLNQVSEEFLLKKQFLIKIKSKHETIAYRMSNVFSVLKMFHFRPLSCKMIHITAYESTFLHHQRSLPQCCAASVLCISNYLLYDSRPAMRILNSAGPIAVLCRTPEIPVGSSA